MVKFVVNLNLWSDTGYNQRPAHHLRTWFVIYTHLLGRSQIAGVFAQSYY